MTYSILCVCYSGIREVFAMVTKESKIRMRYTGKTGYHGLKHRKVYEISVVSMYGKFWVEVENEAIAYVSLTMLCRNWEDVQKGWMT